MAKILIISPEYIKDNSVINYNVDDAIISVAINDSQDMYIQQILGTSLYNNLINKIYTGTTLTIYETNLIDNFIIPALTNYTLREVVVHLTFKVMSKGVTQEFSENSNVITKEDLEYLRKNFSEKAEFYAERAIEYIKNNSNHFTEYNSGSDTELLGLKTSYTCPIVLGRDKNNDWFHDII